MADRKYGAALADFIIAFGDAAFIYEDVAGTPTVTTREGRQVLVPTPTGEAGDEVITVKVFDAPSGGTQLTDLLDHTGASVSVLTVPMEWLNLGQILEFTVNNAPDGDVWLTVDETTGPWGRAVPFTAELFTRLAAAEAAKSTADLADWSSTAPADGQGPRWNESLGVWEPATPDGTGTVTSVAGQLPDGAGAVSLVPGDINAATAADMTVLKTRGYVLCKHTGTGYEPKPSGFTYAIRVGDPEPVSNVVDYDIWLKPEPTS